MWEQIRANRRRSAAVVVVIGLLLGLTGWAFGAAVAPDGGSAVGLAVALTIFVLLWLTALGQGDQILLRMARARPIEHADHPVLFNVVEEMSIAAGLAKAPAVYVVDDPAPNAFATGRDPAMSAVAVTTGLLAILDRDELQGVVAHEIGHIKNRDVSLIVLAGVMVGAIALVGEMGWRMLRFGGGRRARSNNSKGGQGQLVMLALALLLLLLAPLFAQLLYFMLSRRREYLADASGAMYSRYPEALASALEKLGRGTRRQVDQSRVTAPMYIVAPLRASGRAARGWFATHPPIADRVRILRSMAGGAGYRAYEGAYLKVRGRSLIGARTLATDPAPAVRPPAPSAASGSTITRVREASDAFLLGSGYRWRPCRSCKATLKVPPPGGLTHCVRCKALLDPPVDAGT